MAFKSSNLSSDHWHWPVRFLNLYLCILELLPSTLHHSGLGSPPPHSPCPFFFCCLFVCFAFLIWTTHARHVDCFYPFVTGGFCTCASIFWKTWGLSASQKQTLSFPVSKASSTPLSCPLSSCFLLEGHPQLSLLLPSKDDRHILNSWTQITLTSSFF